MHPLRSRPVRAHNIARLLCCLLSGLLLLTVAAARAVAQAGITYRSSATANTGSGASSVTVNKPAGTMAGDVMLANVYVRGAGSAATVTAPPGWTLIRRDDYGNPTGAIGSLFSYYKVATASEPASYSWTFDSSRRALGGIAVYSGVEQSTPIDASGGQANTTSTAVTAPSINTTVANTVLVGFFALFDIANLTPPAGMTERWDLTEADTALVFEATDELRGTTGATGERTATSSFADTSIAHLIALRPAGGGGNNPPTVSITSPANNATFTAPANITINASAEDSDGTISQVEFLQGTTSLFVDTSAPYNYAWNNVGAGSYTLTAKATDNAGATTTSTAVNVTVNNPTGGTSGWTDTGTNVVLTDVADRVGVGLTNPAFRLDVNGEVNATGLRINGQPIATGGSSQWTTSGSGPHIYYNDGNVGIGTNSPTQKLEVNGSALIGTIYGSSAVSGVLSLQSTSSTTKGTINIGVDQTTTTSIGQSGTPGNKLIVATDRLIVNNAGVRVNGAADHGDLSVTKLNLVNADALQFRATNPNITSNGSMLFTVQNINGDNVRFNVQNSAISNAFVIDTNGSTPSRLFDVRDLGNSRFIISGTGNVGIGTTNPTNKLHVAGSISVDGNINAKYQDVAEWVESSETLLPGTVVVLDSNKSNQVIASNQRYDTRVAGVISALPGIVLGEKGDNKVLVATTGRVKIKVSAQNGPINIGDLLVTSDQPGVAMKSVAVVIGGVRIHRPGTLIGKALEPLSQGSGEILVLLSLQ